MRWRFTLPSDDPSLTEFARLVEGHANLIDLAASFALPDWEPPYFEERAYDWAGQRWHALENTSARDTTVVALRVGSPADIVLTLPGTLATSVAGLAVLFYVAKRAFGLDLEFRAHRETKRAEFLEAKRRAQTLEAAQALGDAPSRKSRRDAYLRAAAARTLIQPSPWKAERGALFDWEDYDGP